MVNKQKSYSKLNNVQKIPKKLKIFSLKIHETARTFKNTKTFLNKGTKHRKNHMEGINSKNKNIKDDGPP